MVRLRFALFALLCGLALTGCVALPMRQIPPAPRPLPFMSPLPTPAPFRSLIPRATVTRLFLPLLLSDFGMDARPVSSKKGISLACGYEDMARMAREVVTLRVTWLWNWGVSPPVFPGVESIPNLWDASFIGQPLGGNSQWLLGFNEPDGRDQANMTPEVAAVAWRQIEQTYPDRKLTSPQVLHPGNWLEQWYAAYVARYGQPPRIDALAIHTYYGNSAEAYIARTQEFVALARAWGVPEVWVTEWTLAPGLNRSQNDTADEMCTFVTWLEQEPMVTRYAPFTNRVECMAGAPYFQFDGPFDAPMFALDGRLTPLGRTYRDLP